MGYILRAWNLRSLQPIQDGLLYFEAYSLYKVDHRNIIINVANSIKKYVETISSCVRVTQYGSRHEIYLLFVYFLFELIT